LDKKISPEKKKKVNWFFCYEKIFKNWIKNVNYEDVERRIGFIRNNLSKTLKKVQKKNFKRKNFISEQINEKFKYEIKKYNFVKSFDDLNEIKNEEKFEKIFDKKENKRISVQIFDRKNLNIDLNKKTEFEKFNINIKNVKNRNLKFSMNNFSSSTNFSNNKNSNSLNNNKEINYFKKNNYYSNKINLKKFSTEFPKKIILKENNNNFDNNFDNNIYYIENSNFNKIKLDFNNIPNNKNINHKPFFLDEINLLHQLELNDFLNGGTKNYKTEKYFQLFNFHNLFLSQNFEDSLDNDKQILEAKETCDEIMRIFNSKIFMNSHLLDLEKY